jgi:hypothetical protein
MSIAALRHTKMAEELTVLWEAVSSTTEFGLGRSPNETFRVGVVNELATKFQKQEERHLRLERPGMRVYELILGPPSNRARLADRLEEVTGWLGVEQVARQEVDAEVEALRASAIWIWDMVLDGASGPSSLAASLSSVVELLEGCIDAATTNGVPWGTQSAFVAALWHFQEWGPEQELLGSGCNMELSENQVDAFSTQARLTSDSLASYILPLVARDSPDGVGVE